MEVDIIFLCSILNVDVHILPLKIGIAFQDNDERKTMEIVNDFYEKFCR